MEFLRWSLMRVCLRNPEIVALIVNRIRDCQYSSARYLRRCQIDKCQSQRGDVLKIGLQMIEQSMDGRLFFRGARELHACIAYNVTQHSARIYSDRLGVLPIDFYVSFDNFETIGKCRLAWRYRDHIGVIFEKWIDARAAHVVTSESDPA